MKNKKFGFNLIELLVAVAIIMLLTGGILVYFNDFNSRQKLEGARVELIGSLKLARNYAVTRQKGLREGEVEYVYVRVENDNGRAKVVADGYFEKFLNQGSPKVFVETGRDFCFEVYSGKVKKYNKDDSECLGENIDGPIEIVLGSEAVGNTKTVIIDLSGLIYEGN